MRHERETGLAGCGRLENILSGSNYPSEEAETDTASVSIMKEVTKTVSVIGNAAVSAAVTVRVKQRADSVNVAGGANDESAWSPGH